MIKKRKKRIPPRRVHSLNLALQNFWIKKYFPQFEYQDDAKQWSGMLISTHMQQTYSVKIVYKSEYPQVFITHPQIIKNSPHTYDDNSLCLYYPPDKSYKKDKLIAKTIIPWTCEWLYYYEIWLETGVWWGPEAPHSIHSSKGEKILRKIGRGL